VGRKGSRWETGLQWASPVATESGSPSPITPAGAASMGVACWRRESPIVLGCPSPRSSSMGRRLLADESSSLHPVKCDMVLASMGPSPVGDGEPEPFGARGGAFSRFNGAVACWRRRERGNENARKKSYGASMPSPGWRRRVPVAGEMATDPPTASMGRRCWHGESIVSSASSSESIRFMGRRLLARRGSKAKTGAKRRGVASWGRRLLATERTPPATTLTSQARSLQWPRLWRRRDEYA